mmetsp:Transcript_102174/g.292477  ORF Transcript_102174/g.292477 Transcript_102174/m.292477 type:complete len:222 (+) Transcript_102174:212-877(+)
MASSPPTHYVHNSFTADPSSAHPRLQSICNSQLATRSSRLATRDSRLTAYNTPWMLLTVSHSCDALSCRAPPDDGQPAQLAERGARMLWCPGICICRTPADPLGRFPLVRAPPGSPSPKPPRRPAVGALAALAAVALETPSCMSVVSFEAVLLRAPPLPDTDFSSCCADIDWPGMVGIAIPCPGLPISCGDMCTCCEACVLACLCPPVRAFFPLPCFAPLP